jgi:polyphosphate glucokinase
MADKLTLAIDIGGTGLKASVLDQSGKMVVDRVRVATPYPCTPRIMLDTLAAIITPLPKFDRISAGFPAGKISRSRTRWRNGWASPPAY